MSPQRTVRRKISSVLIIFDLPRPKRDDDISPERAMVNRWAERCTRAATPVEPDGYDGYTSIPGNSK